MVFRRSTVFRNIAGMRVCAQTLRSPPNTWREFIQPADLISVRRNAASPVFSADRRANSCCSPAQEDGKTRSGSTRAIKMQPSNRICHKPFSNLRHIEGLIPVLPQSAGAQKKRCRRRTSPIAMSSPGAYGIQAGGGLFAEGKHRVDAACASRRQDRGRNCDCGKHRKGHEENVRRGR
jgi:hypothetical protein